MWRWLAVVGLVLSGCARAPSMPDANACAKVENSTALLTIIEQGTVQQRLLMRSEAGQVYVALDTVGAPLFRAQPGEGQWQLEVSKLYRGPDAESLLSAFSWWQRREHLTPQCVSAAGLTLNKADGEVHLLRGPRRWWQWRTRNPNQFFYGDYRVDVKPL